MKRIIAGHWNLMPKLHRLVNENKVEAYNFPQDVISMLYRDIAAHRPGHITRIGTGTFVDPRLQGGKLNAVTQEDFVSVVTLDGEEYLFYKSFPIDVAIMRGTTADLRGNVSLEKEALFCETTALAQAAKNSGGQVFVQVETLADVHLDPQKVKVPGIYVDGVVVASDPMYQDQTALQHFNPAYSGQVRATLSNIPPLPLDARKVIARRAAMELTSGAVVNLGIGMPEGIAAVAGEEGISDTFALTVEAGPVGGLPSGGKEFGCVTNPHAIFEQYTQFDFYHGGGLDLAFLGLAQADASGNINVSRFGSRIAGCGGFIGITQSAKKVFFCGTFTAKGLVSAVEDGQLVIRREGQLKKFAQEIEQITFSAKNAMTRNQPVMFITERAVFTLTKDGLRLDEIAPGVDLQRDILDQMDFTPVIGDIKVMDERIFRPERMGL